MEQKYYGIEKVVSLPVEGEYRGEPAFVAEFPDLIQAYAWMKKSVGRIIVKEVQIELVERKPRF